MSQKFVSEITFLNLSFPYLWTMPATSMNTLPTRPNPTAVGTAPSPPRRETKVLEGLRGLLAIEPLEHLPARRTLNRQGCEWVSARERRAGIEPVTKITGLHHLTTPTLPNELVGHVDWHDRKSSDNRTILADSGHSW